MPAIADFSELVLAVGEHIGRNDIVDVMPRFVAMAEVKLNKSLRLRDMDTVVTLTPDTNGEVPLPADITEIRSVVTVSTPPIILRAMGLDNANREYVNTLPAGYVVQGNVLRIEPAGQTPIKISYYAAIPALETATNQTNWLLSGYPEIYLYATAVEACIYTGDGERAALAAKLLSDAVNAAERSNTILRMGQSRLRFNRRVP